MTWITAAELIFWFLKHFCARFCPSNKCGSFPAGPLQQQKLEMREKSILGRVVAKVDIFYFAKYEITVNLIVQNVAKFCGNFVFKILRNFVDTYAKFRKKFRHKNFAKFRRSFVHSISQNFVALFSSKILSIGAKFIFSNQHHI
jgi:hypothetical protein